jgi:hypothetical protein
MGAQSPADVNIHKQAGKIFSKLFHY